jgi:hypothetical protein
MFRTATIAACVCASFLLVAAARAQAPGEAVHIETAGGVVEGILVDRLPQGYLVNKGKTSEVVPYSKVRSISRPGPGAPATPAAPTAPAKPELAPLIPEGPMPGLAVDPEADSAPPIPPGMEPPAPPAAPEQPRFAPAPPQALPSALPPAHHRTPVKTERRSTALMSVGIAAFCAGAVTAAVGGFMYIDGSQTCSYGRCSSNDAKMRNGTIVLGVGAAVAAVGLPLWVVGSARVPAKVQGRKEAGVFQPSVAIAPNRLAVTF